MRTAYYSRNNSYSRSYNATTAEQDGRYPRTIAAKKLFLSVKAFDAGCEKAGYTSTEWHHVGKYANIVYYYDTDELANNPLFWKGATTRSNAAYCKQQIGIAMKKRFKERFTATVKKQAPFSMSYFDGGTYFIEENLSVHNTSKVIREISRNRILSIDNQINHIKSHIPSRLRRFTLHSSGYMFDNKGKELRYYDINWDNYTASDLFADGSVRFIHNNYIV